MHRRFLTTLALWLAMAIKVVAAEPAPEEVLPFPQQLVVPASAEASPWLPTDEPVRTEVITLTDTNDDRYPWPRLRVRAEYLMWHFKDMPYPPLLSTGDTTDPLPAVLGQPSTTVLFGGDGLSQRDHSGTRIIASCWFGPDDRLGVEGAGFLLASRSLPYERTSDGGINSPVFARPFFNAATGQEDAAYSTFPMIAAGSDVISVTTRLWGAEANGLGNAFQYRGFRIDGLAGFRYFHFFESVTTGEQTSVNPGIPVIGGLISSDFDTFKASNDFYGGQLGLRSELHDDRISLEVQAKVALGSMQEFVDIAGQTTVQPAGMPPQTIAGGLYALSSNIGRHAHGSFAVLTEADVNLCWQLFDHVQVQVGYSYIYCNRIARAGAQIDRTLNPNLIPSSFTFGAPDGPTRPSATTINQSDFWVQGINFGVEIAF